jgi:hypothetical protein
VKALAAEIMRAVSVGDMTSARKLRDALSLLLATTE